jgi:hypothetical protein
LEAYTDYRNYCIFVKKLTIGNLLEMIKYKISGLKLSQLPTGINATKQELEKAPDWMTI